MAELKEYTARVDDTGKITISEDVIASIAAIAAGEIEGVASLGTALVTDFLAKKPASKGVKVTIAEESVELFVTVVVKKGVVIPNVAKAVQEAAASAVESMTGIKVEAVNVRVAGVSFDKEKEKKK